MNIKATAGGLLVAIVGVAAFMLWPSDARAIRQRLAAVADAASRKPGEGDLDRVARAASLLKSLTPDIVVDGGADGPSLRGRESVAAVASRLGATAPAVFELEMSGLVIDGKAGRATADVLVRIVGSDGRGDVEPYDGTELQVELAKVDGVWLIARVTREPPLRH